MESPPNLGEARHLLSNQADVQYWLGVALDGAGEKGAARRHWRIAAGFKGDLQPMRVRAFSETTYYSALSWRRLGREARAQRLLRALLAHARRLATVPGQVDYFATSLPAMLLFDDDLQARQHTTARFLQAQARLGLGQRRRGTALLRAVLKRDPSHAPGADLKAELELGR